MESQIWSPDMFGHFNYPGLFVVASGDMLTDSGWTRPGGGNGNPFQDCLENPVDR